MLVTNSASEANIRPKNKYIKLPKNKTRSGTKTILLCSRLNITEAFNEGWHEGLLYTIIINLTCTFFEVLKSSITGEYFQGKYREAKCILLQLRLKFHTIKYSDPVFICYKKRIYKQPVQLLYLPSLMT